MNKIRGNVIGTPIKPEKSIVKATDLTDEQKAQARANIGAAASGETGGIYVGSGDMPAQYNLQIDPEGEALLLDNELTDDSENVPKTKVVKAYADHIAKESKTYPGCFYRTSDRGFTEWLNPPMLPGVEYLTTERHNGEPVWVKLVELGVLPTVPYGEALKEEAIRVITTGEIYYKDAWVTQNARDAIQPLPLITSGVPSAKARVSNGKYITLTVYKNGLSNYMVHAVVKFTKPRVYTKPVETEWEQRMLERIDLAMLHTVALRNLPKCSSGETPAGDVLTGINYSAVYIETTDSAYDKEKNRLVGTVPGTSLSTYYSALENPASVMYTSGDVDPDSEGRSSYYGINCSGFVSYAFGWQSWKSTTKLAEYCKTKSTYTTLSIEMVDDLKQVRRGDMVINTVVSQGSGDHVKLVKDVLYDKDGNLIGFNVVESARPYVRVVFMTPAVFLAQMNEAQPYRVIRLDDSEYGLSDVEKVEYSKSIYPDRGDGGKYIVGENVWLYIPDTSVKSITVDGETFELSNLEQAVVNDVTVYKVTLASEGEYKIATDVAPYDPCTVIVKKGA